VISHPLSIQQGVAFLPQPLDEVHKRDFARLGFARKHGLPEEDPPKRHAIQAALESLLIPALHRMRKPEFMQVDVALDDYLINPSLLPLPTGSDYLTKVRVASYLEGLPLEGALQPMRDVEALIKRKEPPLERRKPKDLPSFRHGKNTLGISPEQNMGRNAIHGLISIVLP